MNLHAVKKTIKSGPFGGIATLLGDIYSAPISLISLMIKRPTSPTAILIGTPTHYNIGDHLIAYNAKCFLKRTCKYDSVIEIPTRIFAHNTKTIANIIKNDVSIFITGGGWMGDLWPDDQNMLERIITTFCNHKIVILPQTIYYENAEKKSTQKIINKTKNVFSSARDLTIICRDYLSYKTALRYFDIPNITIQLGPDIGLYSCKYKIANEKNIIACCLREDLECCLDKEEIIREIKQFADSKKFYFQKISTINSRPIPVWYRKNIIKNTKKHFSLPEVIVTDRLHGMIFAAIVGTKCIALDNKTHKVKGVYELWLKDNSNVVMLENENFKELLIRELSEMMEYKQGGSQWHDILYLKFKEMGEEFMKKAI